MGSCQEILKAGVGKLQQRQLVEDTDIWKVSKCELVERKKGSGCHKFSGVIKIFFFWCFFSVGRPNGNCRSTPTR